MLCANHCNVSITGGKKHSEEQAALFAVRVHAIAWAYILSGIKNRILL